MDYAEALKHLRTLVNVASQANDLTKIQAVIREMAGVIDNALPPKPPHLRSAK
jgi:hypothetical protein